MRRRISARQRIAPWASVGPVRVATFNLLHGRSLTDGSVDESALRRGRGDTGRRRRRAAGGRPRPGPRRSWSTRRPPSPRRSARRGGGSCPPSTAPRARAVDAVHGRRRRRRRPARRTASGWSPACPVLSWQVRRFGPAPVRAAADGAGQPRAHDVPDEPRVGVAAVVEGPSGPFTVVTAHLSFVPGWNVAPAAGDLARWARVVPGPAAAVGDFNLPGPLPRRSPAGPSWPALPTYPSWRPRVQFDHVLADRPTAVARRPRAGSLP